MNLFVGNLSFETTDADLRQAFESFGAVNSATVITERETGRSRGFGFVEMNDDAARAAIEGLNEKPLKGRPLKVNEARPREAGGGNRGGGNRGGGFRDRY